MNRPRPPQPPDDGQEPDGRVPFDPFDPVEASPRLATPLAWSGLVLGVVAIVPSFAVIAGPVGIGLGLVAHVKGSRLGMPAAIIAAVGMIVGMSLLMYLR